MRRRKGERYDKYGHWFPKGSKYAYWREAGEHLTRASALKRARDLRKKGYLARVRKGDNGKYYVWVS